MGSALKRQWWQSCPGAMGGEGVGKLACPTGPEAGGRVWMRSCQMLTQAGRQGKGGEQWRCPIATMLTTARGGGGGGAAGAAQWTHLPPPRPDEKQGQGQMWDYVPILHNGRECGAATPTHKKSPREGGGHGDGTPPPLLSPTNRWKGGGRGMQTAWTWSVGVQR